MLKLPNALAVLRVVTGLLYMQHGMQKLFGWPPSEHHPGGAVLLGIFGLAGILEFFGGMLFAVGWLTRAVALLLCGQMAVAYWLFHFRGGLNIPNGWMPVVNGGDLAIEFCFVFLLFVVAGPGAPSLDGFRKRASDRSNLGPTVDLQQ